MSEAGQAPAAQPPQPAAPFEGLYGFIRTHLFVVNGLVLSCGTIVAALDFLAPRLWVLPRIVYATTAALVIAMMAAAIAPAAVGKLLGLIGLRARPDGAPPLWRHPGWQFATALLFGVTIVGFASVAKASDGGLISGALPAARSLQESLLGISHGVSDIRTGVDAANAKLDRLVGDSDDPQRELVARGYTLYNLGLAIKMDDKRGVALFAKIGYRANSESPLATLLNGDQPWDGELAAMLRPSMFEGPYAGCFSQGALLIYEGKPPVDERIAALKRLCDVGPLIKSLEEDAQRDAGTPAPNDYYKARRESRSRNLPLLKG